MIEASDVMAWGALASAGAAAIASKPALALLGPVSKGSPETGFVFIKYEVFYKYYWIGIIMDSTGISFCTV